MTIIIEEDFTMMPRNISRCNDPIARRKAERAIITREIERLQCSLNDHCKQVDTAPFNALRKQIEDLEAKGARLDDLIKQRSATTPETAVARKQVWTRQNRKELRAAGKAKYNQRIADNRASVDWTGYGFR